MSKMNNIRQTSDIYIIYLLKQYIEPIFTNAHNVNLVVFVVWTVVYYSMYFYYMREKLNHFSSNENDVLNEYYRLYNRLIPFIGYIIILMLTQYAINVSKTKTICQAEEFIDFKILNAFTIIPWFVVMMILFIVLYKSYSLKAVYSKTIIHTIYEYTKKDNLYESLKNMFKETITPNTSNQEELQSFLKEIHCELNKTNNNNNNDLKTTCDNQVSFFHNIHIGNYTEYLKLMTPFLSDNDVNNSRIKFLLYLIKKDMLSEVVWVLQVGMMISIFVYLRLKNMQCLNHIKTQQENVEEYIKNKSDGCL